MSPLHSVTQKHKYLKIIVWCALHLEVLSILDDKKCDPLKINKQRQSKLLLIFSAEDIAKVRLCLMNCRWKPFPFI